MDIIRLMLLSRQMKNRRHEKDNMVTGIPPLNFTAKKTGTLKNYRIYGGTVNGESVGDRTGNLFDSNINVISGYLSDEGILKPANETSQITFDYIPIISGTYTFTYTVPSACDLWFGVCTYDESRTFQSRLVSEYSGAATFTIPDTIKYIRISLRGYNKTPIIMLNEGSTALPYEPYGYRVPVTVSNGTDTQTTTIYLDAPLEKSGNNADYIDYPTQKRHNSDGTESSVTLPEIAVTAGTNTLTVGTEIQPSRVELTGRIKEGES